ncbi:cytochrome P450 [Aspergillus heterothallicus]
MLNILQLSVLCALPAVGFLIFSQKHRRDPREPPAVPSAQPIPLLGHLIGMLQHGTGYFGVLSEKYSSTHPIFTVNLLFTKFYLVTSPDLLLAVQRATKTLVFDPFLDFTTHKIAGIRGAPLEILRGKQNGGHGGNQAALDAMHPKLTGAPLDRLNEAMVSLLSPLVDQLAQSGEADLYEWCTCAITAATTGAVYGEKNPYAEKQVADAFWAFENNLSPLLPGILPSLTARPAYNGRKTCVAAFEKFFLNNGPDTASELIQARYKVMCELDLDLEAKARAEFTVAIGLLSNTVPASFWIIYDLYSRPELLAEIRAEVNKNAVRVEEKGVRDTKQRKCIVSIPALRDNCPLFLSTYQEILRYRSTSSPMRFVTEDTLLADEYLLKKGNVLSIPARSMGMTSNVWGRDASSFNPRRFLKSPSTSSSSSSTSAADASSSSRNPRRTGGLMSFGVSPVICPGRHFASSEIMAIVTMIMLRLDIVPENAEGEWRKPDANPRAISSIMNPIKGGFPVRVKVREGYEGVEWGCEAKQGASSFNLMIG